MEVVLALAPSRTSLGCCLLIPSSTNPFRVTCSADQPSHSQSTQVLEHSRLNRRSSQEPGQYRLFPLSTLPPTPLAVRQSLRAKGVGQTLQAEPFWPTSALEKAPLALTKPPPSLGLLTSSTASANPSLARLETGAELLGDPSQPTSGHRYVVNPFRSSCPAKAAAHGS